MMPLMSHVPARAPTINSINIAPVVDLKLFATSSIMVLYETLLLKPTIAAIEAPIRRINWLEPLKASSPYTYTLYANSATSATIGINASKMFRFLLLMILVSSMLRFFLLPLM